MHFRSPSKSKPATICTPVGKPVNVTAPMAQNRQSGPRLPSLTNVTNTSFSNLLEDDDDDFELNTSIGLKMFLKSNQNVVPGWVPLVSQFVSGKNT